MDIRWLKKPSGVTSYVCQAVPGIDFVDVPDVVFSSEDGKQASVGVVELNRRTDLRYTYCAQAH